MVACLLGMSLLDAPQALRETGFRDWIIARASGEGVVVLEWGSVNLDADAATERVAKLCSAKGLPLETWIFEDDDGARWRIDYTPHGIANVQGCPSSAPKEAPPWRSAPAEFRSLSIVREVRNPNATPQTRWLSPKDGTAAAATAWRVSFGSSGIDEGETLRVGFRDGTLVRRRLFYDASTRANPRAAQAETDEPIGRKLAVADDPLTTVAEAAEEKRKRTAAAEEEQRRQIAAVAAAKAAPPLKQEEEPGELTAEMATRLDSIPPPGISGRFKMDGKLDDGATLISSSQGLKLYAVCVSPDLYVALVSDRIQDTDSILFIADAPGPLRAAPDSKKNQVAGWLDYLENRTADRSIHWYDASGNLLYGYSASAAGTVIEGAVDIELLLGATPYKVFVAAGKYDPVSGALLGQAPRGNRNRNIDAAEFHPIDCK